MTYELNAKGGDSSWKGAAGSVFAIHPEPHVKVDNSDGRRRFYVWYDSDWYTYDLWYIRYMQSGHLPFSFAILFWTFVFWFNRQIKQLPDLELGIGMRAMKVKMFASAHTARGILSNDSTWRCRFYWSANSLFGVGMEEPVHVGQHMPNIIL